MCRYYVEMCFCFSFTQVQLPSHSNFIPVCVTLYDTAKQSSKMIVLCYILSGNIWDFWMFHSLINIKCVILLKFSHNSRCLVMSAVFICIFLMTNDSESIFVYLFVICMLSFVSYLLNLKNYWNIVDLQFFFPIFLHLIGFFVLPPPQIVRVLYMLCRDNSSSDICVMNIVFQSVSCLFIFLTMSFDGWVLKF